MTKVWMFAGQGTQFMGMGLELYQFDSTFRSVLDECDSLSRTHLNHSVISCLNEKHRSSLEDIKNSNLTLFCIQYALAKSLMKKEGPPDYFLGYSLGEFIALTLAGSLALDVGLNLVAGMAEIAVKYCPQGRMMAVLDGAAYFHRHPQLFEDVELAALNTDDNIVVAGESRSVERCNTLLQKNKTVTQFLPVNYGFHSSACEPMRVPFSRLVDSVVIRQPQVPVLSAHTARVIDSNLHTHLWRVIRCRINFLHSVLAIEKYPEVCYRDFSPTGSLANAVRSILPREDYSRVSTIATALANKQKIATLQSAASERQDSSTMSRAI